MSESAIQAILPDLESNSYSGGPFLKWAGGKTQLLSELSSYFPKNFGAYYEPFVGGAAVFFYLRRTRGTFPAWLNDGNPELINCYTMVRDNVNDLLPYLRSYQQKHSESYYYTVRAQGPDKLGELQRAARFIYLNKTCFNGLYRVNARGQFNVPIGSAENPRIFDEANLREASRALQGVDLAVSDFRAVLDWAKKGDFVYFDPPYHTVNNGFTGYIVAASGRANFGPAEHRRLSNVVDQLRDRECYVMVSNSDTEFIRQLYHDYEIHTVLAKRLINSNGNGRGPVNEVIITSYGKNTK